MGVLGVGQTAMIFTYGTLKKGFSNHRLMEELMESGDASYVGAYRTSEKYPLVCGPYRVPFLLNMPGKGQMVYGEVYEVSGRGLERMDELEGTSRGHYERQPIRLELETESDRETSAMAYFGHPSYSEALWKRNGERGYMSYTEIEAKGYVKRKDRPQHMSFLDHISHFVSQAS